MTSYDEALAAICDRRGVSLLLQFGSTVSGQVHPGSDLDIAALFTESPTLQQLADLAADLQAIVPDQRVDLAVLNRADPLFLRQITERCRLLHGSSRRLMEFKAYAFRRYQEHRRFLVLEREYVARFVAARGHR